ncbi:MAG TPA: hypothetical protein VF717_11470 [Pyrinomonadaceae bacterium]
MSNIDIETLSHILEATQGKQKSLLVGIDGCGGSGKSTLASALASALSQGTVVKMDDFYLPSMFRNDKEFIPEQIGSTFDWRRLKNQVLVPLSENRIARYQRYDWDADSLVEWHAIPVGGIVIVEGVYSTRRELAAFYDFRIWVQCRRELRLARGIARDGVGARDKWEREWMPLEDNYVESHRPHVHADWVINGNIE